MSDDQQPQQPRQTLKAPSYIVTGQTALQHAVIHGTQLYSFAIQGPIPLHVAMRLPPDKVACLFAAVDSLPGIDDRQMMAVVPPEDTREFIRRKVAAFEDEQHKRDMRTLIVVAVALIIVCIVFASCLIVPRLV